MRRTGIRIAAICAAVASLWVLHLGCGRNQRVAGPVTVPTGLVRQLRLSPPEVEEFTGIKSDLLGRALYVYGFHTIVAVDAGALKESSRVALPDSMIYEVSVCADGRHLAAADYSGYVLLLSTHPLRLVCKVPAIGRPMRVAYDLHGHRVYYSSPQQRTIGYVETRGKRRRVFRRVEFIPSGIAPGRSSVFYGADEGSAIGEHDRNDLSAVRRIALPNAGPDGRPIDLSAPGLGPSEVSLAGECLYVQAPISRLLWEVDLISGRIATIGIGHGTGELKVLAGGRIVSPGDGWNLPGQPTSLVQTRPSLRLRCVLQSYTPGDCTDRVWCETLRNDGSRMYTIASSESGTYLQERSSQHPCAP